MRKPQPLKWLGFRFNFCRGGSGVSGLFKPPPDAGPNTANMVLMLEQPAPPPPPQQPPGRRRTPG